MKIEEVPAQLRPELCSNDFERTYTLNSSEFHFINNELTEIVFRHVEFENLTDERDTKYRVFIRSASDQVCTRQCVRTFFYRKELFLCEGQSKGRVVNRDSLELREAFKRRGISRALLKQEEEILFQKWGACEIHLIAASDGPIVWTKPEFGYELTPDALFILRFRWEHNWRPGESCTGINSIEDVPDEFWQYAHKKGWGFPLYKSLVKDNG
jgi:GNAT superfamily N-acetyltransferase